MKKVGLFFVVLMFCFSSFVLAQDPGIPDTCKVDTITVTAKGQHFRLQVRAFNDANIGGLSVPLRFSGSSLVCDSGSFVGTRIPVSPYAGFTIDNVAQTAIIWALWITGYFDPGEGLIGYLYFTVRNDAVSETVYVDTITTPGNVSLEFTNQGGIGYTPVFKKGTINVQLPGPVKHPPVISVPGPKEVICDSNGCDSLSFLVTATDLDASDILTMTKYGKGNFNTTPRPSPDTGFFKWTPVRADTLNSPYTDTFIVDDGTGLADTGTVMIRVKTRTIPPAGHEGDLNGDGKIDATDVIYLVNFLFKNGPGPIPPPAGDINGDCFTTVEDVMYLINYLYRGGPAPKIRCNPGDADYDGYVNISDVVYLVNYLFKNGPMPRSMKSCDVNADCEIDVSDATYLISYLFRNGPALLPGCME
ncbi:MAG: dockerin type I repeat-containing protein [candidate division Zixibacteria bacterium]|nr:dockerin type I repeat-containing protein [candidate division Zixibacteria bacterium]